MLQDSALFRNSRTYRPRLAQNLEPSASLDPGAALKPQLFVFVSQASHSNSRLPTRQHGGQTRGGQQSECLGSGFWAPTGQQGHCGAFPWVPRHFRDVSKPTQQPSPPKTCPSVWSCCRCRCVPPSALLYRWQPQIKALNEAGYRTIAPDLLGLGKSAKPTDLAAYDFQTSVTPTMLALVDALSLDKFSLVGHDFGAGVAWGLAFACAARVERVVVLSVGFFGEWWGTTSAQTWHGASHSPVLRACAETVCCRRWCERGGSAATSQQGCVFRSIYMA